MKEEAFTVASYEVGGVQVVVPQRVDPEREPSRRSSATTTGEVRTGALAAGAEDFASSIAGSPEEERGDLKRLLDWARNLERDGLARLMTRHDPRGWYILLPWLLEEDVGLVTVWNTGKGQLQIWRSAVERRAPASLTAVEKEFGAAPVTQGGYPPELTDGLLDALTLAYGEAASGRLAMDRD